jgi:small subunit ribosomal protein S20
MAHTLSALKRLRQSAARNERNKAVRSEVKTQIKKVKDAIDKKDAKKAQENYQTMCALLDKAVSKGVLHLNNASRHKSRLAARLASISKKS